MSIRQETNPMLPGFGLSVVGGAAQMRITLKNMTQPNFETEGKHSVKNNHENSVLIGVRPEVPHPGPFLCRTLFELGRGEKKRSAQLIHYYGPSARHRWCHNRIISMTGLSPLQRISIRVRGTENKVLNRIKRGSLAVRDVSSRHWQLYINEMKHYNMLILHFQFE